MHQVFLDSGYTSEAELQSAIDKYIADLEKWKTSTGIPKPLPDKHVQACLSGDWEFFDQTIDDYYAEKREEKQSQFESEKAASVGIASDRYIEFRLSEYPPFNEQLDIQYWDSVNGSTTWSDLIKSIKERFPKPESGE